MGFWHGTAREPPVWQYFGERLVQLIGVETGQRVLDVGTGGGAVLIPAARAVGPGGQAVGIDISGPWTRRTAQVVAECGLEHVETVHMDASQMGFADGCFDLVLSGFVGWDDDFDFFRGTSLRPSRMLAEMVRVLKDGGRVGISSWVFQEDREWMRSLVQRCLAAFGDVEGAVNIAFRYSRETAEGFETLLRGVGLQEVYVRTEHKGFVYEDEGAWLAVMRETGWHRELARLESLSSKARGHFERDALAELSHYKGPAGIHFSKVVLFACGTKRA